MKEYDVIVIGGGPAGLAAAISAKKAGAHVGLIEREARLGGILKQCIHDGFGLVRFKEKLAGPEYADRFIREFEGLGIEAYLLTFVTALQPADGGFDLTLISTAGLSHIFTKSIVLATGCRERTAKQVSIHGDRPAGVFTAGCAQNYINLQGQMIARNCVILGSGDIGLIMARRLTLEGAKVLGVYEVLPQPSGLARNVRQCLEDFDIPLHLSTTVTRVFGKERVEAVETAQVDERLRPILGTEQILPCDTLIVSVGLIPENELAEKLGVTLDGRTHGPKCTEDYETSVQGVFACGNCLHVYDLVDYVSQSGEAAGAAAARYAAGTLSENAAPMQYEPPVKKAYNADTLTCIVCPNSCEMKIETAADGRLAVSGNRCKRGEAFARQEMVAPMRSVTTTVRTADGGVLPARTSGDIPKERVFDLMNEVNKIILKSPVCVGDVIAENVLGLGVDIIATDNYKKEREK